MNKIFTILITLASQRTDLTEIDSYFDSVFLTTREIGHLILLETNNIFLDFFFISDILNFYDFLADFKTLRYQ